MNLAALAEDNLRKYGEYERLWFEGRSYTNRELFESSRRLAMALKRLGLRPDDKVVVMMMNSPEVLVSYPAIWRAGGVVVPVLFLLEAHELRYILEDSQAAIIITSPELLDKVREASQRVETVRHIIVSGEAERRCEDTLSFDELVGASPPQVHLVDRRDDDLAVILYTSGTTGRPKGVMQTHKNLLANAMNAYNSATNKERLNIKTLLVLPLAHSFGLGVTVGGHLFRSSGVLMRWFDPEPALRLIEEHRIEGMAGVPTMFVYMMNHPKAEDYDTSSVTRWLVGAAPMPQEQKDQFEKKFGGTLYVGYGLTESCPGIAFEREDMPRKPGSTGVPMEGVEVKIVDEDGKDLARGQIGEIIARGENISPGYYKMPEETAQTFCDGWLYTGDIGYLDEDNYLFIVERKKDLIIRGGLNVYPKDVEEFLARHPAVQECAVVGVPDSLMGEEVCAFVVTKYGIEISSQELISHCQHHLAKYKTPRYLEIVSSLPKTTIGKIQKKELRAMANGKYAK
jgi:long-chain acyl-CoA synthetase